MSLSPRCLSAVAAWLLGTLIGLTALRAEGEREPVVFSVGLSQTCFANVNRHDAAAAYRALMENVGMRMGYRIRADVVIYGDTAEFMSALSSKFLHVAVMDSWQYLDAAPRCEVRPYFVPAVDGKVGRRFVILCKKNGSLHALADLKGRSVLRLDSVSNGVCQAWLESILDKALGGEGAAIMTEWEPAAKPVNAVLPVFFGQKDACVVDDRSFEQMKELNPQVGRELSVLAQSESYTDVVICLGEQPWEKPQGKTDIIRCVSTLSNDANGEQVLTLFRISGMERFNDAMLDNVRELRRHLIVSGREPGAEGGQSGSSTRD